MSALTYSWHVSNVQCVGSTTRPLSSHSAQVKKTRRSVYDSESDVKKMAVGHHLGECSHTIERSHNLLSGKRVERQDFVNLEEGGSEWVWDQGGVEIWMWDWRGEWVSAHLGLGLGPEGVRWVFVSGDSAHLH